MKKKTYTLKPTKKQLEELKIYWSYLIKLTDKYYFDIKELEIAMENMSELKGVEFIWDDMGQGIIGIGNFDRTMKLIQREELEKNEE